ncbi:helix-turn-helix domain-containing protein [Mycolicibacterium litorale]|uniref:Cupin n=1 Tax=Mycolicibacterium litorale TaxID=758802 RepID=A0AAD1MQG8_9MYCO|nr:cupin domain-containing protein [Mycolicibacterium litorale]MCV7413821.1 cupin domain-containing protein [Mycolicibacterium litorale]TDY03295.1 XRE family transcriptional regulator [Mycolicibacterium litorale]BBY15089.1 cupin [Mycolicibacterium litorale]
MSVQDVGQRDASAQPAADAVTGARIREFRLARKMTLRELAARAEMSPGFLSQLERGQVNASVGSLRRLAESLGITLPDLFADSSANGARILRKAARPEIHVSDLSAKYLLSPKPLRNIEVYAGEFAPGASAGEAYVHGDSQEILVVISGSPTLELDGVRHRLEPGDSAEYRTSIPHTVHNDCDSRAELLWIVSPPTD